MKTKSIIQVLLALVIVGLGICLYASITKPMKFENEYNTRRDACAEKLKAIRMLEESYKSTYGCFCGSFDTLFTRLINEDSLLISQKIYNYEKIQKDGVDINEIPETEAFKKGYVTRKDTLVNPIEQLREAGKLPIVDKNGYERQLTNEEIMNLCYVPYTNHEKFQLQAGQIERSGLQVPVFECKVDLSVLLADLDEQDVANRIDQLEKNNRYPGWKVGDMNQSITEGNFE